MYPSEMLRLEISKKNNVNLEKYKWSQELLKSIFSIKLDEYIETNATTLGEIYKLGFNIGHCGLTSRYLARTYSKANLIFGKAHLLVGTNNSPNGEHAWITIKNYLIDTTLMICIPLEISETLGYTPEKEISKKSACVLSEYDTYDTEFHKLQKIKKQTL